LYANIYERLIFTLLITAAKAGTVDLKLF